MKIPIFKTASLPRHFLPRHFNFPGSRFFGGVELLDWLGLTLEDKAVLSPPPPSPFFLVSLLGFPFIFLVLPLYCCCKIYLGLFSFSENFRSTLIILVGFRKRRAIEIRNDFGAEDVRIDINFSQELSLSDL